MNNLLRKKSIVIVRISIRRSNLSAIKNCFIFIEKSGGTYCTTKQQPVKI